MSTYDPAKLSVEHKDGITAQGPIIPRRYTLTHSDDTGNLFLTIGTQYALEKITEKRDEVLAEWIQSGPALYFSVYLYIDNGEIPFSVAVKRDEIFSRELPLALTAIRDGDRSLFNAFPYLDQVPIIVTFQSAYPKLAKREIWGSFHYVSAKQGKQ